MHDGIATHVVANGNAPPAGSRFRPAGRRIVVHAIELALIFLAVAFLRLHGFGRPAYESLNYLPSPDAAEQATIALALAEGRPPLLPIGGELFMSRFSPVHPWAMSLWLRLRGGGLASLHDYPPIAWVSGTLLIWLALALGGLSAPWRLLVAWLTLASHVALQCTQRLMQEPTMLALFGVACVAWVMAISLRHWADSTGHAKRRRAGLSLAWLGFFVAGLATGGLACIRPTVALLPPCMALAALEPRLGWRRAMRRAAPAWVVFAAGNLVTVAIVMSFIHGLSGMWDTTGYHYWDARYGPHHFAAGAWRGVQPNSPVLEPLLALNVLSLFGWWPHMLPFGAAAMPLLLLGGCLGFFTGGADARPSGALDRLFGMLALFSLSQLVLHCFYRFFDIRFFVFVVTSLAGFGALGWQRALRGAGARGSRWTFGLPATVALVLAIGGAWRVPRLVEQWHEHDWNEAELKGGSPQLDAHRLNALIVNALDCPVFVEGMTLLNTRLLLGMAASPQAVAPTQTLKPGAWDPHIDPHLMGGMPPALGRLPAAAWWPHRPIESWLRNRETGEVRWSFIEELLERHGRFVVYFPYWLGGDVAPLLDALRGHGLTLTELNQRPEMKLIRVSKGP